MTPIEISENDIWYMHAPWMPKAREWAESKMPKDWDRNSSVEIGLFYCFMLEFLHQNFNITSKEITLDEFSEWLDKQIAVATTWDNAVKAHEVAREADQFRIRAKTLQQVREKFLTLTPPPTTLS